ncbi:unannotated protein [freshwater metagenome]|uniref:Unannotated protein n=1 Tax=freshwater metagenome TaxID=449393 RepID=A0A6J7K5U1_9ZZZZ
MSGFVTTFARASAIPVASGSISDCQLDNDSSSQVPFDQALFAGKVEAGKSISVSSQVLAIAKDWAS